jgi:hypothetical protein
MALFVVVGGAFLFACGGDDDDDDGGNGGEPTAEETMDDGGEPTDGGEPSDGEGDINEELRNLAAGVADQEAKVAYNFTATGGGEDTSGTFTLYWKPPSSWRFDMDMDGQATSIISKDGTSYICSGDGAGGGTCFASPATFPFPFFTYFTDPNALTGLVDSEVSGVDFDRSSDSIAGQDVTCYTAEGTVEGETGSGEYCFNGDGLLMRLRGESADGSITLEAESAEGTVPDADLELPYDIMEIPGA